MFIKPTYTELEKKQQIDKVLNLINSPIQTETDRKNLLYNLSYMNNMVVKGYMQQHSKMDERIYEVKDMTLDFIVKQMPNRCFLSFDDGYYVTGGYYVIYIYVNGRQYSFHTLNKHGMDLFFKRSLYVSLWDGLKDGWKLSDAEYKRRIKIINKIHEDEKAKAIAKRKILERNIKKAVIGQIHQLQNNLERVKEFKRVMEEKITPAQRRTKAYQNYKRYDRWERCWELWGRKWGFRGGAPDTYFYYWCCADTEKGRFYAKSYFEKVKSHYNLNY